MAIKIPTIALSANPIPAASAVDMNDSLNSTRFSTIERHTSDGAGKLYGLILKTCTIFSAVHVKRTNTITGGNTIASHLPIPRITSHLRASMHAKERVSAGRRSLRRANRRCVAEVNRVDDRAQSARAGA